MKLLNVRCDCCKKQDEGEFVYFRISRQEVNSFHMTDETVGESDLCEDCYKKLTRGELYKNEEP